MLTSNFAVSACVIPEANGSRSQLVTNRFLIELSQVFGWGAFTSRDVSKRFGLDFLKTAKMLSRMSKRPYYLLSAVRVSRPYGGYENSYTISPRGWSKIIYLQGQSAPVQKPAGGNLLNEMSESQYLFNGKGTGDELFTNLCFRTISGKLPPIPSCLDDAGRLLTCFDWWLFPHESMLSMLVKSPTNELFRTMSRVGYLQSIRLVPADINVPLFVLNAYHNGSSQSTILLHLLFRGGIELRDAYDLSKIASEPDLWDSRHYKDMPEDERRTNRSLKLENDSLKKKLDDAHHDARRERLRLDSKIDRLVDLVKAINECLLALSQGLGKFEDTSPTVTAIKSYIRNVLKEVAIMNYAIVTKERRDST